MDEETFIEQIYDSVAASRNSIRVNRSKPLIEDGETYYVTFMLNIDSKTNAALCAAAEKQERSVTKMLRRFLMVCFRDCIEVQRDDVKSEPLKAA